MPFKTTKNINLTKSILLLAVKKSNAKISIYARKPSNAFK